MFYQLPPVGNPVRLFGGKQPESLLQGFFSPYTARYFASGTAALAAAIAAAASLKGIDSPEVILPAYGCPDLVSATLCAGAKPVLVDLEPNRPWMDLDQLPACITPRTVAIIAVHLFGIPERMAQLHSLAGQAGALLIEDSAQYFPGAKEDSIWTADLVVLSFGRGKPVSLLGGGAVLVRDTVPVDLLPVPAGSTAGAVSRRLSFLTRAMLYNLVLSPWLYWVPQGLPFLHLGETRFHSLSGIDTMDPVRRAMLSANVQAYRGAAVHAQHTLTEMLQELDLAAADIVDLPGACGVSANRRLLRYPLLLDKQLRDRICQRLKHSGLGPSGLYPAALPAIAGLETAFGGQGPFPRAEAFAQRILTLPVHGSVRDRDVLNIRRIFKDFS